MQPDPTNNTTQGKSSQTELMISRLRRAHLQREVLPTSWRSALKWAVMVTLALRIGLGLVMGTAWMIVKPHLPTGALVSNELYDGLPVLSGTPLDAILGVWVRWDAVHHLNLARLGYFQAPAGDSVFYPLYPAVTRLTASLTGGDFIIAGLLVSTLACIFLLALLYRLAERHFGEETARWSVIVLAVYPLSLFLIAPYSESLFIALCLAAFLAAEDRRWWLAGIAGFLAALTRPNGILIPVGLAYLAWRQGHDQSTKVISRQSIPILGGLTLPVLGSLIFLAWRSASGFDSIGQILNDHSGLIMADPLTGLITAIGQWLRVHDLHTTLDVFSALIFIALIALMMVRPRWRRWEWIAFAGANMLLFLSKKSFIASSLQSMSRYVLVLFPAFILLGNLLAQRSRRTRLVTIALSSTGLIALSAAYTLWIFVG
ncbi:MAG TPA: hypothetical protein G4O08_05445 [Anaerolineae bacterium]|nr:hypothetical protein [Anaerolineae bacterium]